MILEILQKWNHGREILRAIRNCRYEITDQNEILLPDQHIILHGLSIAHWAPDDLGWQTGLNILVTEGLNHLLDVATHGTAAIGTWYVGAYSGNVTPVNTWTAANFASNATELTTQIQEATRPAYVETAASAGANDNYATPATITANTTNVSINGCGVLSSSTKGGTTGTLLAAEKFATTRTLASVGDTLGLKVSLAFTST